MIKHIDCSLEKLKLEKVLEDWWSHREDNIPDHAGNRGAHVAQNGWHVPLSEAGLAACSPRIDYTSLMPWSFLLPISCLPANDEEIDFLLLRPLSLQSLPLLTEILMQASF